MSDQDHVFAPPRAPVVPVVGGGAFPVRRIFCIGKNYADHVKEMGGDAKTDPPVFFSKPADAVIEDGADVPYPQGTDNLHFEGELVVAIGSAARNLTNLDDAAALIYGYAAGCDLTRRDLQSTAKARGGPWDAAKGFDNSAPIAAIAPGADVTGAVLETLVNGESRQSEPLTSMIWSVPEIIVELSNLYHLQAGDLIFTGTPAGVGPLIQGDSVEVSIGELPVLRFTIS